MKTHLCQSIDQSITYAVYVDFVHSKRHPQANLCISTYKKVDVFKVSHVICTRCTGRVLIFHLSNVLVEQVDTIFKMKPLSSGIQRESVNDRRKEKDTFEDFSNFSADL